MTREVPETHPLHRLFRGLTESTFLDELGIGDPGLVGYLSGLLARFASSAAIWAPREEPRVGPSPAGGPDLLAMLAVAESSADPGRRRRWHRHVGDVSLYWTGVYPEAAPRPRTGSSPHALVDLRALGKRSYRIASTLGDAESGTLRRLSDEFEECARGLSKVRREWESLAPPAGLDGPGIDR